MHGKHRRKKAIGLTPIEELITEDFGELDTPERDAFELCCDAFTYFQRFRQTFGS